MGMFLLSKMGNGYPFLHQRWVIDDHKKPFFTHYHYRTLTIEKYRAKKSSRHISRKKKAKRLKRRKPWRLLSGAGARCTPVERVFEQKSNAGSVTKISDTVRQIGISIECPHSKQTDAGHETCTKRYQTGNGYRFRNGIQDRALQECSGSDGINPTESRRALPTKTQKNPAGFLGAFHE